MGARRARWPIRGAAVAAVLGATVLAFAATGTTMTGVTFVPAAVVIDAGSGSGSGTTSLMNATTSTYDVRVGSDASCDPAVSFTVSGGNPSTLGPSASRAVGLQCAGGQLPGLRRCVLHATDTTNNAALADMLAICEYAAMPTLGPSTALLDFGSVMIGNSATMTIDLTNNSPTSIGRLDLQTTDLDGNFQFSTPCNPDAGSCNAAITPIGLGASTTVTIKCTPQTTGAHTANLVVATDTSQYLGQVVQLTCTGTSSTSPVLGVSPSTVDIATPVEVMGATASAVVHLANTGGGTLLVSDVRPVDVDTGAAMDWTYTASGKCSGAIPPTCMLGPGDQVDINLTFDPSDIGTRRASLLVSYHDTLDRSTSIPLDGVGQGARLALVGGQTVLDLGVVPLTHTGSLAFELSNSGNRDTTAMLALMPTTGPFSLSPATSALVTPTAAKAVTVSCTPTVAGMATATITVTDPDVLSGSPIALTAQCEGSTLDLYALPGSISLGEIRIGQTPRTETFQLLSAAGPLTLAGPPTLEVASPALTLGMPSSMTTPATFDLTIAATVEGDLSDRIVVSDTAGDTLHIPITGRAVTAAYLVSPTLDLGTFCINQPTTSSNLSLSSSGTATIGLGTPTLAGAPSPFELSFTSPTTYPASLPAGQAATVAVTPGRRSAATTESDVLTWHTDVAGKLTATTMLGARFIDTGGAIAPPAIDFGKVSVHVYQDDGQRVMIQNCNGTALELIPPVLKLPFSIDSPNFPATLNPNETAIFSVGFHPNKLGAVMDTLTISSPQLPNAPLTVALYGEGVADGSGDDGGGGSGSSSLGETSFYACGCRSAAPGGALPIVLAVMCVLFPRRRRR